MSRDDVNWLLQTIKDPDEAECVLLAQYERGRISLQMMADIVREQGWINRTVNEFLTVASYHSIAYATMGLAAAVA
jgi:hypothetical protein